MITRNLIAAVVVGILATSCTKPVPEVPVVPAAAQQQAVTSASTIIYNAYTSNAVGPDGVAGQPGRAFLSSDKVYVGVVLHGQGAAAVSIEWSNADGVVVGREETNISVTQASVATLEVTKSGPLKPGAYRVLVSLDGKPGWELFLDVAL